MLDNPNPGAPDPMQGMGTGVVLTLSLVGWLALGCGHELGPLLAPAAETAAAVLDCVHACEGAANIGDALRHKAECTPRVLSAARAWCDAGVLADAQHFCEQLP